MEIGLIYNNISLPIPPTTIVGTDHNDVHVVVLQTMNEGLSLKDPGNSDKHHTVEGPTVSDFLIMTMGL